MIFFLALAVLLVIAFVQQPKEGFQNLMGINWTSMNEGTPKALYTDLPVKQPMTVDLAELGVGNIQPSPPPAGTLPSAPIDQRAKETPSPYINPVVQPARYIQLLGVKEDLQAFFGFQAPILEERNDPAIQIPLTRARADMSELIAIQSVMERNPGLPSRITNKQLDDIRSNLRYLRDALHDLETSGAVRPEALEAFQDVKNETTHDDSRPDDSIPSKRASLTELQDFQIRVVMEITRLGASGTSDPVLQARLNTLNAIKNDLDQVLEQLKSGAITPETVPIFSSDIQKALPVLGNPSDPLPQLLQKNNLPPAIANLFPGGMSPKNTEQANQINNIVKGYMKNLFEGASWGVNLMFKYDNPTALRLQKEANHMTIDVSDERSSGLPYYPDFATSALPTTTPYDSSAQSTSRMPNQQQLNQMTDSSYDNGLPGTSRSRVRPPSSTAGQLDWKQRAQQIKEQVRLRGLNPADFGAIADDAYVSPEFSWRGHAQMMCSRLNTTTDPGLAATVGCPPVSWKGWQE